MRRTSLAVLAAVLPAVVSAAGDPLSFEGREAAVVETEGAVTRRDALDVVVTSLRLSPSGARWAARREDGGFLVGDFSGARHEVPVSDLVFLDEHRALALTGVDESSTALELRTVELDGDPRLGRARALPRLDGARLELEAGSLRWRVTGVDLKKRELVRVAGAVDGADSKETRWPGPPAEKGLPFSAWSVGSGGAALVVDRLLGARTGIYRDASDVPPWHSEIWTLAGGARELLASTSLELRCLPELSPDATCLAVAPRDTYVWAVDARGGRPRPLASVRGRARQETALRDGRIALWIGGTGLVVLDPAAKRAERIALADPGGGPTSIAAAGERIGLVLKRHRGSEVVLLSR